MLRSAKQIQCTWFRIQNRVIRIHMYQSLLSQVRIVPVFLGHGARNTIYRTDPPTATYVIETFTSPPLQFMRKRKLARDSVWRDAGLSLLLQSLYVRGNAIYIYIHILHACMHAYIHAHMCARNTHTYIYI